MAQGDFVLTLPQMRKAAELYRDGLSRRQVAAHFGRSEDAVRNALRFMGVPMRERKQAAAVGVRQWKQKQRRVRSVFDLGAQQQATP